MKILILQDDFPPHSFGGAGVISYNLARELVVRGHEVHVLTAVQDKNKSGVTRPELDGMTIHRIHANFSQNFQAYKCLWNPSAVREVQKVIAEFKPDVVHAHGVHTYLSYWSLVAAKRSGVRVIFTCHDVQSFNYGKLIDFIDTKDLAIPNHFDYRIDPWLQFRQRKFRYNPFRNFIIRWIVRNYVDVVTAVSYELKNALEINGFPSVAVVHNGIDVEAWKPNENLNREFKEKHKLGDSVILFGGRISPVKGSDKLLDALVTIRKNVPDVQLLVASQKDEFFQQLKNKAEKLGVSDAIIGTDWITGDELKAAYYNSVVVAVPTLSFDSFPTMNLEAFACKKSVVATCFGGSHELVEDGVSGYIVNPYDVSTLAEKITDLLSDKDKQARFGNAGHDRVMKEFTLQEQAKNFEDLYAI